MIRGTVGKWPKKPTIIIGDNARKIYWQNFLVFPTDMQTTMAANEPKMGLGPFDFRPANAKVKGRPPLAEWQGPLQFALWCQRASPWWIGDMINSGEDLYGEEFGEVCGATLSTEMVSRYASVARRVPAQNRRPALSWSAHASVARLPHAQQRRLLAEAEREGWNSDDLRKRVQQIVKANRS